MSKLIQSNPYYYRDSSHRDAWAEGFEVGQKSTLLPKPSLVTGRWWQAGNGNIFFIPPEGYKIYELTNKENHSRWLTEEETREF